MCWLRSLHLPTGVSGQSSSSAVPVKSSMIRGTMKVNRQDKSMECPWRTKESYTAGMMK